MNKKIHPFQVTKEVLQHTPRVLGVLFTRKLFLVLFVLMILTMMEFAVYPPHHLMIYQVIPFLYGFYLWVFGLFAIRAIFKFGTVHAKDMSKAACQDVRIFKTIFYTIKLLAIVFALILIPFALLSFWGHMELNIHDAMMMMQAVYKDHFTTMKNLMWMIISMLYMIVIIYIYMRLFLAPVLALLGLKPSGHRSKFLGSWMLTQGNVFKIMITFILSLGIPVLVLYLICWAMIFFIPPESGVMIFMVFKPILLITLSSVLMGLLLGKLQHVNEVTLEACKKIPMAD